MTRTVYVGWDKREQDAFKVAVVSLLAHSNVPPRIVPLKLAELPMLTRPIEEKDGRMWCPISKAPMATEFAISRFCVPFLQKSGWALFMDCDVLVRADIEELFQLADDRYAVMCVKHNQDLTEGCVKMDGQVQTFYNRKNWSSVALWNCGHPSNQHLTLEALNTWPGRDLHAFKWLVDKEIGALPVEWNYLVGVTKEKVEPKIAHFTLGTPNLPGYENCEFADEWRAEALTI